MVAVTKKSGSSTADVSSSTARLDEVHRLIELFPDLPQEALFKEDMLRWHSNSEYHEKIVAYFHTEDGVKGVNVSWRYNDKAPNKSLHHTIGRAFEPFPKKWGRGEWVAKTMDDARQMAIDFAEGVS